MRIGHSSVKVRTLTTTGPRLERWRRLDRLPMLIRLAVSAPGVTDVRTRAPGLHGTRPIMVKNENVGPC